ncbi:hypothetical protein EC988_003534 [Linderina pennispora]|nr:hypothetical protein EC988_003534 [Linderina pennispora]
MGTDRLHDECEGACRLASHPAEPSGKPRHVRFMETHLDCICSDMAVAEALYMQHYPLSLSLKNFYVGTRGSNLMLASRMVVLMSLLCPRIGLYDLCGQPAYDSLGQRLEQSRLESTRQRASHA